MYSCTYINTQLNNVVSHCCWVEYKCSKVIIRPRSVCSCFYFSSSYHSKPHFRPTTTFMWKRRKKRETQERRRLLHLQHQLHSDRKNGKSNKNVLGRVIHTKHSTMYKISPIAKSKLCLLMLRNMVTLQTFFSKLTIVFFIV